MNIAHIIEPHRSSTATALVHGDAVVSYASLAERIDACQAGLESLGVTSGDQVVLVAGTTPDFVVALFAVLRVGAVAVPLNPLAPAPEIDAQLGDLEATLAIVGSADLLGCRFPETVLALPGVAAEGWLDYETVISEAADRVGAGVAERAPDDVALLLFTSGTAGAPKAAMLTHGNLLANIDQVDAVKAELARPDDIALGVLPLFHILGLNLLLGLMLRAGGSVVLVERFDPGETIELIERLGVTVVTGPPAMWQAWANHPGVRPESFASVRIAISGAAGLPREVAGQVASRLGVALTQGYGLTEASPVLTLGVGTGAPATSVGRPIPGVSLRLVDSSGDDVPGGDEGEVWANGDNIFPGYWRNPEATAEALTPDGWLRTGDIGVVDDDGFLYIVDRSKDLIVVSGFNVFPGEVEAALRDHPSVAEAAVVGVDDPVTGEAVKAVVVAAAGETVDEQTLIDHCAERLARYKCPVRVEVVDELPTGGAVGKLRRRHLR